MNAAVEIVKGNEVLKGVIQQIKDNSTYHVGKKLIYYGFYRFLQIDFYGS